jgi:hypothetical protein
MKYAKLTSSAIIVGATVLAATVLAATVLAATGAAAGPALARPAPVAHQGRDPGAAVMHAVSASPAQVIAYWTAQRMYTARPMPLVPATPAKTVPAKTTAMAPPAAGPPVSAPPQAPPGPVSRVWTDHGKKPATTVGRLFFTEMGKNFSCSASVITATNRSTIWTAGRCVSDGEGHWAANFMFVPDTYAGLDPFGKWTARYAATPDAWFRHENLDYDFAALALNRLAHRKIQNVVGAQGVRFGGGYALSVSNMGHGSSGGPWLARLNRRTGLGFLVGDNSNGGPGNDTERSPHLGRAAASIYARVEDR